MDTLPKISSVFLNVTNACNLACRYCFVEQHPGYMSIEVAKDAVRFLIGNAEKQNATPAITFFGGEPMLCWDSVIKPLIQHIRQELAIPFSLSMTTNGTLLTEDIIEYLHKNDVGLLFSIDGDKATQDYNRPCHGGESSFDILEDKIPLILKYHPNMTFRSTLIPETCEQIFENIKFAESCGYNNFFLIPNVFQTWGTESRRIAEAEVRKYSDYFIESFRSGRTPIRCNPMEEGFRRILEVNQAVLKGKCRDCITAYQKCGLGATMFGSIDYRGNVYACQEMVSCKGENDPFYIGTIYDGTDDELRRRLISQFNAAKVSGENCDVCKLRRICDGGCAANNYLWGESVNSVSPDYCWWMKLMLNEAIYISTILGNEQNEAFQQYWYSLHGKGGCQCLN